MIKIINNQYHVDWNGPISFFAIFSTYSYCNFVVPSILTKISTKKCLFFSSFVISICLLIFLYPIRYFLLIQSFIVGLCSAVLYTSQCQFLAENSNVQTIDYLVGVHMSIHQAGWIFGNLYFYFQYNGIEEIKEQDRIKTYSICIILLFLASVLFLFLKSNKSEFEISPSQKSSLIAFKRCFRLLKSKEMLLLLIPCFYTGRFIAVNFRI